MTELKENQKPKKQINQINQYLGKDHPRGPEIVFLVFLGKTKKPKTKKPKTEPLLDISSQILFFWFICFFCFFGFCFFGFP